MQSVLAPTFIYVAKNSIAISRKHGLFTALGTGTGAAIFPFIGGDGVAGYFIGCAFGIFAVLKFAVVYICYFWLINCEACQRASGNNLADGQQMSLRRAFSPQV